MISSRLKHARKRYVPEYQVREKVKTGAGVKKPRGQSKRVGKMKSSASVNALEAALAEGSNKTALSTFHPSQSAPSNSPHEYPRDYEGAAQSRSHRASYSIESETQQGAALSEEVEYERVPSNNQPAIPVHHTSTYGLALPGRNAYRHVGYRLDWEA